MSGREYTCTKCGAVKCGAAFPSCAHNAYRDGLSAWCRECHNARGRERSKAVRSETGRTSSEVSAADADRFWSKVDHSGGPSACWPWTGARDRKGYGRFSVRLQNAPAHRIAMALVGRDPGALCALHSCDNPACCNPAHLEVGTLQDNNRHIAERGRAIGRRARVPEEDIDAIIARLGAGVRQAQIAREYDVSPSVISNIKRGIRRRRV